MYLLSAQLDSWSQVWSQRGKESDGKKKNITLQMSQQNITAIVHNRKKIM